MSLEAEVAYLHLIDGVRQTEVPPGYLVRPPPRRAARGRDRDLLLLAFYLDATAVGDLAELAASVYFGTPGSVTAAARAAITAVNEKVVEHNQRRGVEASGGLCCAALRGSDLYIAQVGPGRSIVIHPNAVERFPDPGSAALPPLGLSRTPDVQYFHTAVSALDYLLIAAAIPVGWQSNTIVNLPSTGLESAIARLTRSAGQAANAMIVHFMAAGTAPIKQRPAITAQPIAPPELKPEPAAPPARAVRPQPRAEPPPIEQIPEPASAENETAEIESAVEHDRSSLAEIIARMRASPSLGASEVEAGTPPRTVSLINAASGARPAQPLPDDDAVQIGEHIYEFEEENSEAEETVAEAGPQTAGPRAALANWRKGLAAWFAQLPLNHLDEWLREKTESLKDTLSGTGGVALRRILPEGTLRPETELRIPNSLLIAIAILLPVAIASFVGVVYVQRGRDQQFKDYLAAARLEAGLARTAPDPLAAKPHWETTLAWIDQAEAIYPGQPDSAALHTEAQQAIDSVESIQRLAFEPLVPGGFGPTAKITEIVINGSEVYALDSAHTMVYRALLTEPNKFTIDRGFQCEGGAVGSFVINRIVDIAWLNTPNVVGQAALMAMDDDGVLMYCKPDGTPPEASQLIAPDAGWKQPRAIEIYADRLYVFDPGANEIWLYDRPGGVFSEQPKRYFTGQTYDLSTATGFTIAQGDVYILRADGHLTFCTRDPNTLATNCVESALFTDTRAGHTSGEKLDDVKTAAQLFYDPPPEPSLYLLDRSSGGAYQLSLKLVLQRQYRALTNFSEPITAIAIGANKEMFAASGNNVYWAKR